MPHIAILSSSVRTERKSHRVALYFKRYLEEQGHGTAEIIDLKEYQFPIFEERLRYLSEPGALLLKFSEHIKQADGVIVVTPEYNGGYPAALKNAVDLLYDEWQRKPVAIATVSSGNTAGMNVITSIQYTFWKIGAWTVPALFAVAKVQDAYGEDGTPQDKEATDKRAARFIGELLWCIKAKQLMKGEK